MRKQIATAVLSAAVMVGVGLASVPSLYGADAPPATRPATDQAQIPVRQVVLFSSGVGYFEHFGTVTGDGSTTLNFKSAQINDILKSLVLQDMDKGHVEAITYPSQDPIARTLRSFQVDITNNPSLHELLNQLRGARVTVILGAERLSGTVLGAEKKEKPEGAGPDRKVVEVWQLNLLVGTGIRPVPLDEVRDVQIEDPQLREELNKALAALAQARDQDKKPVTVHFAGQGERRVRIGYVVETPVWKTSYRLLVDGPAVGAGKGAHDKDDQAGTAKNPEAFKPDASAEDKDHKNGKTPATQPAHGGAGAEPGGKLQGWAIIENQTDSDWNNVQLSLVSGRPISFIQDLYRPLYVPRPVVQPELYASLRPQTYEGGMDVLRKTDEFAASGEDKQSLGLAANGKGAAGPMAAPAAAATPPMDSVRGVNRGRVLRQEPANQQMEQLDAAASVASAASATKLGELFEYTVGSVTLPRQKSAMIPILTDPLEVERLSIYNANVLAKHPLYGARIKNTTGKHLLQGPITVLQGGSYAGDARIEDLPPGQERLISYGIDLEVQVQGENAHQDSALQTAKLIKGVLQLTHKVVTTQEYVAENKGDRTKTLIIEQPRNGGDWKLVEPAKATETTDALYRFKDTLAPNHPKKLTVKQEIITNQEVAILPMDVGQVEIYARTGEIPKPVRDALAKAAQLKGTLVDTQRQIQERQQKVQQITAEQQRLRENMKTVNANTEYYNRLLKKLDDQESQIEKLQQEIQGLQKDMEQQRKALEDYLAGLSVG